MKRSKQALFAVVVLSIAAVGTTFVPANAQVPSLPPPPAEVKPALGAVSPAVFQACQAEATAISLLQVAALLGGLPINPGDTLGPVRDVSPLGLLCGYIKLSVIPPRCSTDDQIPPAPVTIPRPASLAAAQVKAIEKALNAYGAGLGNQASAPVYAQLGCKAK